MNREVELMKIAILGTGNMGAWFARELSRQNEVFVYDIDSDKTEMLKNKAEVTVIDRLSSLKDIQPGMLLNAVNLEKTVEIFDAVREYLTEDCIIADITSVKNGLPDYYDRISFPFVSTHPMFGPTFADLDHLKQENAIIIKESDEKGAAFFRDFYKRFNLTIFEYSFSQHDEMMAYSLSLPFVSSLVFAACMKEKVVPGSTFAKQRKIADGLLSEDDRLISEILFNDNTLTQLEKVTSRLEYLKHIIRQKDFEEARLFFERLRRNI